MSGERIQVVPEYKYYGVLINSKLTFKSQVKMVCSRDKFSVSNFIRFHLPLQAAKVYKCRVTYQLLFNNLVTGEYNYAGSFRISVQTNNQNTGQETTTISPLHNITKA